MKSNFITRALLLCLLIAFNILAFAQQPNRPPQPQADFYIALEEIPTPITPLANDTDPDGDNLNWRPLNGPFNGRLDTLFNGTIVYIGDLNYFGPDFIFYRVCDDGTPIRCAFSTITINVVNVNDRPVAVSDTFTINEDQTALLNVLQNDLDVDNDPLEIRTITTPPQQGAATIVNNRIQYTPAENYYGTDVLRYRVCDTSFNPLTSCAQAFVYITVLPVNDAPVAVTDSAYINIKETTQVEVSVLGNDFDIEEDSLKLTQVFAGNGFSQQAILSFDSNGVVSISSQSCGRDTVYYVVCDYQDCDTGNILLEVYCPYNEDEDLILLPEGFSPNGDGLNDVLVFKNAEVLKPIKLQVFNRFGTIVFESADYQNNWDGTHRNEPLPDGTYFYQLELPSGKKRVNYLMLNR